MQLKKGTAEEVPTHNDNNQDENEVEEALEEDAAKKVTAEEVPTPNDNNQDENKVEETPEEEAGEKTTGEEEARGKEGASGTSAEMAPRATLRAPQAIARGA